MTVPTTIEDLIEALSKTASIIIQISGLQSDTKEEMTSSTIKLRALTDHSQVLCVVKAMYVAALKDPAVTDAQRNEIAQLMKDVETLKDQTTAPTSRMTTELLSTTPKDGGMALNGNSVLCGLLLIITTLFY